MLWFIDCSTSHLPLFLHPLPDAGALFSGADIIHWMLEHVAGVEGEEDAVMLGQLLLDQGAIFHSEGST